MLLEIALELSVVQGRGDQNQDWLGIRQEGVCEPQITSVAFVLLRFDVILLHHTITGVQYSHTHPVV